MEVHRGGDGSAVIRMNHAEVRELLGAFALSMAAYGLLQNFMLPHQRALALPSIAFISSLGALLAADEEFAEDEQAGITDA
jgi:hypothetical protein